MLTKKERLNALKANLSRWPWDIYPTFKIDKEEAEIISEILSKFKEKDGDEDQNN